MNKDKTDLFFEIEQRHKRILENLPTVSLCTIGFAVLGFFITSVIQFQSGEFTVLRLGFIALRNPTIGSIISFILTLFSVLTMWIFVIWSVFFIPYIAYRAHKVSISSKTKLNIETKSFRWLQLYLSTLLPTVIFAIAWSSVPDPSVSVMQLKSFEEWLTVIVGSLLIWGSLWFILKSISIVKVTLHLSFLSSLLYISIFITYGFGYGEVAYSTLFGIFLYLTFTYNQLEEIGRRIAIFDIDPELAEYIEEIAKKRQKNRARDYELDVTEGELESKGKELDLKRKEIGIKEKSNRQDTMIADLNEKELFNKHKHQIRKTELEFHSKVKDTTLEVFKKKVTLLKDMYEILSDELDQRMNSTIPEKISQLQENVKGYSPDEIQLKMMTIYTEMEASLSGFPESLQALRLQMDKAVKELHHQTEQLEHRHNDEFAKDISNLGNNITISASTDYDKKMSNKKNYGFCPDCQSPLLLKTVASGEKKGEKVLVCKKYPKTCKWKKFTT